jgi:hypothetical protein
VEIWSQLSLLASYDVLHCAIAAIGTPDFSIQLHYANPALSTQLKPRAWLADNIDVMPPEIVLCAELEKVHISLNFITSEERTQPDIKRSKFDPSRTDINSPISFSSVMKRRKIETPSYFQSHSEALSNTMNKVGDNSSRFPTENPISGAICAPFAENSSIAYTDGPKMTSLSPKFNIPSVKKKKTAAVRKSLGDIPHQFQKLSSPQPPVRVGTLPLNPLTVKKDGKFLPEITEKLKAWLDANNDAPKGPHLLEMVRETGLQKSMSPSSSFELSSDCYYV